MFELKKAEAPKGYKYTKLQSYLDEFVAMDIHCAEVITDNYASTSGCVNAINEAAKRSNRGHIKACSRGDRVFIINTLKEEL